MSLSYQSLALVLTTEPEHLRDNIKTAGESRKNEQAQNTLKINIK